MGLSNITWLYSQSMIHYVFCLCWKIILCLCFSNISSHQRKKRLCLWQRSTRSRCLSPPSCFWPLTSQQLHCTKMRRSSLSFHRSLSLTSWASSMEAQRRYRFIHTTLTLMIKSKDACVATDNILMWLLLLWGTDWTVPFSRTVKLKQSVLFPQHFYLDLRFTLFTINNLTVTMYRCAFRSHLYSGIQNLQREFSQKVPVDQTASVPHLLHQKIHQEQLLCGKEPHHCQLPYHVSAVPVL